MGIKSLSTILNQYAKNGMKNVTLDTFRGKVIAIDTSIYLYKFTYNTSDYLEGFTRQILRLLKNGITPLFVFDGKPPDEKQEILNDRKEKKEILVKKKKMIEEFMKDREAPPRGEDANESLKEFMEELKSKTDEHLKNEIAKIKRKIIYITHNDIVKTKRLFDLFGVPHIAANGEAEAFCAVLSKNGFVDGCITEDTDYLASGGYNFIRNFNSNNNNISLYKIRDILDDLNVTYEQFIDICILCGCDYTTKITGIGAIKAYKFIKKYGTIEGVINGLATNSSYKVQDNFDYKKARSLLKCEDLFDLEGISRSSFKIKNTDEQALIDYLKENSEKLKVKSYNEIALKLGKYKQSILTPTESTNKQRKIGDFFKKKYFITEEIDISRK
jgi:flap endonuclease-1